VRVRVKDMVNVRDIDRIRVRDSGSQTRRSCLQSRDQGETSLELRVRLELRLELRLGLGLE
jgi:hypothetical protein